jgi:hypothetical protein
VQDRGHLPVQVGQQLQHADGQAAEARAGDVVVIEDAIDAKGAGHSYTLLLNGMAGEGVPGSVLEALADGARWTNPPATVEAHVLPAGPVEVTISHDIREHQAGWGQWKGHERLSVAATMGQAAGFLTVLAVGTAGQALTIQATARPEPGVAGIHFTTATAAGTWTVITNGTGAARTIDLGGSTAEAPPGLSVRAGDAAVTYAP